MPAEPTLDQVIDFIVHHADRDAVQKIFAAGNQRMSTLRTLRAAAVSEGMFVRIVSIKPKPYEGLEGHVKRLEHKRKTYASIQLTKESTDRLRAEDSFISADTERYELTGIPAAACELIDEPGARS